MRFGIFYEHQLPKPWSPDDEYRLLKEALEQVVLADRLGFDYAWEVEHHFLDEYSTRRLPRCSSPPLQRTDPNGSDSDTASARSSRTTTTRREPPRAIATLDLISDGRVDFGIGEGATRLELHGFDIPAKKKRAMSLEAAEQIANMMVMEPYPGFDPRTSRCRAATSCPSRARQPHPPMWMACTNRDTIKVAARNGLGALAFSFVDPEEARTWADIYYDIIKSDECVPLGHCVNANLALVTGFSLDEDRTEAIRRGQEGFEFFGYALNALVCARSDPGAHVPVGGVPGTPHSGAGRAPHRRGRSGRRLVRELHRDPRRRPSSPRADGDGRRRPGDLHPAGGQRVRPPSPRSAPSSPKP